MADKGSDCDVEIIKEVIVPKAEEDLSIIPETDMDCDVEIVKEIPAPPKHVDHKQLAECKKEEGNSLYKQERYTEALQRYSEAIALCPESTSYYSNRAACHIMVQDYQSALEDIQMLLKIDEKFVKGHMRAVKCYTCLGDLSAARRHLQRVQEIDPKTPGLGTELSSLASLDSHLQRFESCYEKHEYRQALFHVERLLEASKACTRFRLFRSECLAALARYQEAQEIANDILKVDSMNADATYIRGLCLYYQDNVDKAFSHFQRVLQLAPDHSNAKEIYKKAKSLRSQKDAGNNAFKNGQLEEAYNLYTSALNIDPSNIFTNAKLYFNRATVCSKIKKLNQAIEDCTNAIKLDSNYLKAYLRRAKCYLESEMFEDAVRDYEVIYSKDKNKENKRLLDHAKLELKKSKRKDYYKILGISKTATDDEIKKAYKKQALVHHPDRHSNETDEKKLEQEKKFKELGEAYAILSDTKKRHRYDNGMDIEEEAAEFDPTMFQSFFAGPGGFFGGGGGGNSSYNRTFSTGFPSGYGNSFSFHFG